MKYHIAIAIFLTLSSLYAAKDDIQYNQRVFTLDGVEYVSQIPNTAPSPIWKVGIENVPLSMEDAFKLANSHFKKNFNDKSSFSFQSISLQRWGTGNEDKFLYLIVFMQDPAEAKPVQLPGGGVKRTPLTIVYYVSLDGILYAPERK